MVNIETFRKLALAFPDAEELPHFETTSFRYKKKIFATYHPKEHRAMLKLSPVSQSVFCTYDNKMFFPVPGGWGLKGATFADLHKAKKPIFKEALTTAYDQVANKSARL